MVTSFWGLDNTNKTLRRLGGPAATGLAVLTLLLGAGLVAHAAGRAPRWHVVQGSDGTLYLLSDSGRYTLQVDPISDEDLAALPDAGPIGPFVGAPPEAVSPESAPPSDTSGEQSLGPPAEASPVPPAEGSPAPLPDSSPVPLPESSPVPLPESVGVPPLPEPATGLPPVPEVVPPVAAEPPPASLSTTPSALGPMPPSAPASSSSQPAPPRSVVPPPLSTSLPAPPQSLAPVSPISPTPTPTATVAAAAEPPVLISGSGSQTTRTFTLRGGTYTALWSATTPTSTADTFAAILRPADPANLHTQVIATALLPGSRSISGQTELTGLPAGTYSVDIVGGTNWTLSVSGQTGPGAGRP